MKKMISLLVLCVVVQFAVAGDGKAFHNRLVIKTETNAGLSIAFLEIDSFQVVNDFVQPLHDFIYSEYPSQGSNKDGEEYNDKSDDR
jgi:hypothetical protein